MRDFTRLMLSAYPKIPRVIEGLDRTIEEGAMRSFYEYGKAYLSADRLMEKLNMKNALTTVLYEMKGALTTLTDSEREILQGRFFGSAGHSDLFPFSKTTYYRRLKKAVLKVERFFKENRTERKFKAANLGNITFFRYLKENLSESRRKAPVS